MAPTMPATDDTFEVKAGATPKGHALVIVPTSAGLYKIEYRGAGTPPAVTNQFFTSLSLAKREMERYMRTTAPDRNKEALKKRIAEGLSIKEQRKQLAQELKNGEVSVPDEE